MRPCPLESPHRGLMEASSPELFQMVQAPSPKRQSRAAIIDSPCKEVSKRSPFCYRWEKPGQACLFKLHYPLQTFALTDELEEDFRSISNRSRFSSSVLSLREMLCQEHIQPWKQISRHNKAQTCFLKNSVWSESIFPASYLQQPIPVPFLPKQKCLLQPDLNHAAAVEQIQ